MTVVSQSAFCNRKNEKNIVIMRGKNSAAHIGQYNYLVIEF